MLLAFVVYSVFWVSGKIELMRLTVSLYTIYICVCVCVRLLISVITSQSVSVFINFIFCDSETQRTSGFLKFANQSQVTLW